MDFTIRLKALLEKVKQEKNEQEAPTHEDLDSPDQHYHQFEVGQTIEDSGIIKRILEGSD